MFQSHEAHKKIMKKSEFAKAPALFWMKVLDVGVLQPHLIAEQIQLVGTEIPTGMGVGRNIWA